MPDHDHYAVLGLDRLAGPDAKDVGRAYRERALRWHPDKNRGKGEAAERRAREEFERVFAAYEVLRDADRRAQYDGRFLAQDERRRRESEMDSARLRMKKDLEQRERDAVSTAAVGKTPDAISKDLEQALAREIQRLREQFAKDDEATAIAARKASKRSLEVSQPVAGLGDPEEDHDDYENRVMAAILRKTRKVTG